MPSQEFIQALTDLHLSEVKTQPLTEFWNSVLLTKKQKSNKNCLDYLESLIYSFFVFRSHQWCKKFIQKEKRDLKKRKIRSPNDSWKTDWKPGITEITKDSSDFPLRHYILPNISWIKVNQTVKYSQGSGNRK